MKAIPIDFIGVDEPTLLALEELARAEYLNAALQAQIEQEEFARHCRNVEFKAIDGIGEVTRQVHGFAYHDWAAREGGYEVWKDKGFNRYMDRVAPETRVKCVAPKSGNGLPLQILSVWDSPNPKRYSKKFEEAPKVASAA